MPEQAVVLNTDKRTCDYYRMRTSGVIKIIEKVRDRFLGKSIYAVFGEFPI